MNTLKLKSLSIEEQVDINGGILLVYAACFVAGAAVGYLIVRNA